MYAIIIWDINTSVPSVIGPYESDLVFDDARLLKEQSYKVVVCSTTTPDKAEILTLLSKKG